MAKPGSDASVPLLPPHPTPNPLSSYIRRRSCFCNYSSFLLISAAILTLLGLALFLIWPFDLRLHVARIRIDRIRFFADPNDTLSIDLRLRIRARNPNFFSLDYDYVDAAIGYRGESLGYVVSAGGHIRARGVSYWDAELRIDGIQVIHNVFYLIEDIVRGSIPFDAVSEVRGLLHLLVFDVPVKGRVSCSVNINPANQTIVRQDCYPEAE